MVGVIGVVLEDQGLLFNDGVTLLANVFAQAPSFLAVMAWATQVPEVRAGEKYLRLSKNTLLPQIMFWHTLSQLLRIPLFTNTKMYKSPGWHVCNHLLCRLSRCYIKTIIRWDTYLPAFLTKPTSASTAWQISQQKQSGCQLLFMALMTRPIMNSPVGNHEWEISWRQGEVCLFQWFQDCMLFSRQLQ